MAAGIAAPGNREQETGAAGTLAGQLVMHTAEEAARLLKVKRSWLERQAAARKIPFSMLGGSYRFSDRHLAEIVRRYEMSPLSSTPDDRQPVSRRARHGRQPAATAPLLRPRPRNRPPRA
jgi:excisionase family DNA binding protein